MQPVDTIFTNINFVKDGFGDLPAHVSADEEPTITMTWWRPTADELDQLKAGAFVRLAMISAAVPPIAMEVDAAPQRVTNSDWIGHVS